MIINEPSGPSNQPPELPTDTGDGAGASRPEVTGDPGNQTPKSREQDEPEVPGELVTPKKDKELKGHKKESEVYQVKCQACGRYFASIDKCRDHIRAYHQDKLRECDYCKKKYLNPWDYNTHLDNKHVWWEPCQGYMKDQRTYDAHYKAKHEQRAKTTEKPRGAHTKATSGPQTGALTITGNW